MRSITEDQLLELLTYDPVTGIFTRGDTGQRADLSRLPDRPNEYRVIRILNHRHYAHRLAWRIIHGAWPTEVIDHIDGNPGNNSLANLRACNEQQNASNRKCNRKTLKGVTKFRNSWLARIMVNYKIKHLGSFATEEAAHAAYLEAAEKHFGEFARAK